MRLKTKRGQVAIFVIIALVIVAAVIALFIFRKPSIPGIQEGAGDDPRQYLRACLTPSIKPAIEQLTSHGGYSDPAGFIVYNDSKVAYLCYTSEYYKPCIVQQPNIYWQFEQNLKVLLQPETEQCLRQLKEDFEKRGYSVSRTAAVLNISIVPETVGVLVSAPLTITKEFSKTYREFEVYTESQLYDLLSLSSSIIDFESTYGDSETTLYLQYYPDITINKIKLSDGTKIYTVGNVISKEQFRFASRSLAWPPGYGLS